MDREQRLKDLYSSIYSRPGLARALDVIGKAMTALVALSFTCAVGLLVYTGDYLGAVKLSVLAGIPFVIVSLMREIIDCNRPYEVIECDAHSDMASGRRKGHSFPSRHVFSAFIIGTLWMILSPYVGAATLLFGAVIAISRVLLGIHFLRDVLTGAIVGSVSVIIGELIFSLV